MSGLSRKTADSRGIGGLKSINASVLAFFDLTISTRSVKNSTETSAVPVLFFFRYVKVFSDISSRLPFASLKRYVSV